MTRACRNCQWWDRGASLTGPALIGTCRGGPPSVTDRNTCHWPVTEDTDWCGAFRMAERMAGGISNAEFEAAGAAMAERLASIGRGTKQ